MRIAFAGSGEFAVPALEALVASRHEIVLVLTRPDRRAGRGRRLTPTPVRRAAMAAGLRIAVPVSPAAPDLHEELAALAPDALVVVDYGRIVPAELLAMPRFGGINVHPSLLPRWRGAAPVERALEAGDRETGVSIMQMDAGLDTGPVLAREKTAIEPAETAGELGARLARRGARLLVETLDRVAAGQVQAVPQAGAATYAERFAAHDARLDFGRSAAELVRRIHAFNPRPGAWTECDGERLKLLRAALDPVQADASPGTVTGADADGLLVATGDGTLRVVELQRPGRRPQPARMPEARRWIGRRLG